MRFLSLLTDHCIKTAEKHSLLGDIKKLSQKVEFDQTVQSWDTYLLTPFIKKDLGKSFRLVASKHIIESKEIVIIAFVACFARGGSGEYEKFIKDPAKICGKYLPDEKTLNNFLKERKEPLPEPVPKPNDIELQYLYNSLEKNQNLDVIIYESPSWVEAMKQTKILEMSTRIYDLLFELIDNKNIENNTSYENQKSDIIILYKYLSNLKCLFLIAPVLKNKRDELNDFKDRYSKIIRDGLESEDSLLKESRRSYPSFLLADETMWKSIQKNEVGNIALSPEESMILESLTQKMEDVLFPLFINGRPGSGKSTILQYLFASYLYMHLQNDENACLKWPPLYLTYSENLLKAAKENIRAILKCNTEIALNDDKLADIYTRDIESKCYGVFQNFLLKLLPFDKQQRFVIEKKIEFSKFRDLWNEQRKSNPRHEIRRLTPEIAWHVIRSYIKGMRYDYETIFTPESYEDLPAIQRSVQLETFEKVYINVWNDWYKPLCDEKSYWDDQDLVFEVLNEPNIELSKYPAIFCDEAQDFSKLELDLMLRLSLYSEREMPSHMLKHVPFAFAGDPFQTLNPTGFDWDSLQASFHEKIVSGLDRYSCGKLDFNYQELTYNYRSSKFIVGLCNLFQLLRGIIFDQRNLKPQLNWFNFESTIPSYFDIKDPICEKTFTEQTELVIILPCEDGEEDAYVKNDTFLSSLSDTDVDMRNVLSPMRAKGLEFSRVVLYKFGYECLHNYPNLLDPINAGQNIAEDKDVSLPLKYFMNRLYVAASRAKNRLIIVDDEEGINFLWNNNYIKNIDNLLSKYANSKKLGWQSSLVNYVQEGVEDSWIEDRDDPLVLAEEFQNSGLIEKDSYKLRLAEANYIRCKRFTTAKECKAQRLEIEEKLSDAAEIFLEINKIKKSLKCFWAAGNFNDIENETRFMNTPEQRAAVFFSAEKNENVCENILQLIYQQISTSENITITWDPQWKIVFDKCIESILTLKDSINFRKMYSLIQKIESEGMKPSDQWKYAEIAYEAKQYKHALELWESKKITPLDQKNYCFAKAYTSTYPSNIIWLNRIKQYDSIIEEWEQNKNVELENETANIISKILFEKKEYKKAIAFLERYPNIEIIKKIYNELKNKSDFEIKVQVGKLYIKELSNNNQWTDLINLLKAKNVSENLMKSFSASLCIGILQSKSFTEAHNQDKNEISKILKRLFIDSSWDEEVPMRVAGASIEKAYKIIDALDFYESVWKTKKIPANKKDRDYAVARWVKSKIRLAEFLDKENKTKMAGKHRAEADMICQEKLGMNKDNIPDEPEYDLKIISPSPIQVDEKKITVSEKQIQGILSLYSSNFSVEEISEMFKQKKEVVLSIIEDHDSNTAC